ncbi:MAG: TIM barrel protein [Pirellulaceae bacterium]
MIHPSAWCCSAVGGCILWGLGIGSGRASADEPNVAVLRPGPDNLMRDKLVAWCVVPFDAAHRSPEQRAKCSTTWESSVWPTIGPKNMSPVGMRKSMRLKRHNIELTGWWCASSLDPLEDAGVQRIVDFFKRRGVHTQLWLSLPDAELQKIDNQEKRVARAAYAVQQLAEQVAPLGCQVGLYNHGGWIGEPANLVRIMQQLADEKNVGIVYNFHHAHHELGEFPQALAEMKPYLLCLNLNGTNRSGADDPAQKVVTLGEGELDSQILGWIAEVGYMGPIGILDHREQLDARESLKMNLDGLDELLGRSTSE